VQSNHVPPHVPNTFTPTLNVNPFSMKNLKLGRILALASVGAAVVIGLIAADHVDAPAVAGSSSDIADFFAFEGADADNTVFVVDVGAPLAAGMATSDATFDENVLIEINIDNTGDFVEDLVIQAIAQDGQMYFTEPTAVAAAGTTTVIASNDGFFPVEISSTTELITGTTSNGVQVFAGPRRDPFYFDFNRFNQVVSGMAAPDGFLPPAEASDFFAELNTMSVVVEVPNDLLGTAPAHVAAAVGINGLPDAYNVWATTKRRQ